MSDYPCQMAKHIHRFEDSRTLVESLTAPRRLCLNPLRRRQRPRAPGLALIRPWWARIRTGVEAPRTSPSYSATTTPSTSAIPWGPAQSRGRRTRCPIGECPPLVALEFEWDTGSTSGVQNRGFGCCTASWFRTIACFISFLPRFNTLR